MLPSWGAGAHRVRRPAELCNHEQGIVPGIMRVPTQY